MGRPKSKRAKNFTRTILTGAALFLSHSKTAYAGIDVKNASFSTTFVDLETASRFKISRTYDSRSTHNGLFGFGWCSNLDRRLHKDIRTPQLSIENCGKRTTFDATGARPTKRWIASDTKQGSIELEGSDFVHRDSGGRMIARYDGAMGALAALVNGGGQEVPILRGTRRSLLRDAASGEGTRVRLEVDPLANKILAIETSDGTTKASYQYHGDDLIKATNAWNNTYHFRYDPLHNLLEARYPDSTTEEMTYDADHDRLTSFKGRNSCNETYSIEVGDTRPDRRIQKTTATKTCGDRASTRVTFEFDYRKSRGTDGRWRLSKLTLVRDDGKVNTIDYDKGDAR